MDLPDDRNTSISQRPTLELLSLAAPTIAQMASYTVMQFCDTWMLSLVGVAEATAAGLAGLVVFTVMSFGVGCLMVVNTLVSQSFGREDRAGCGRYLWQGIWFAIGFGLLVLPTVFAAGPMFRAFGHEPHLAALEAEYFIIVFSAVVIRLTTMALGQFLLAIGRPNITLMAALAAVVINLLGNYLLIYGKLGFPRWGVAGAAWATNVGVCLECAILAAVVFGPKLRKIYHTFDWPLRRPAMRTLLGIGVPSGAQVVAEVSAWSLFSLWILNFFGTAAIAANNFMMQYMKMSFMPAIGVSAAVTALVGRYIGRGRPDLSMRRAHLGYIVTAAYMVACGILFFVFRDPLMRLFTDDPEVRRIGRMLLIFAAFYQILDATYIIYIGALRGAGDTRMPAIIAGALCWVFCVGLAWTVARFFPWTGLIGLWSVVSVYGLVLGLFLFVRFMRGGWKSIQLDGGHESATVRGFEALGTERFPQQTSEP